MENDWVATNGLIECARNDVHAARVLFLFDNYPLAVYHAAQAIEKVVKVLCGGYDGNGKPLFPKTHRSMIALLRSSIKQPNTNCTQEQLDKICCQIDLIKTELATASAQEIRCSLNEAEKITQGISVALSNLDKSDVDIIKSPEVNLSAAIMVGYVLFISMYLHPHDQSTRYPDNPIKPWEYTIDLGIVECLPEIIDDIDIILSKFDGNPMLQNRRDTTE